MERLVLQTRRRREGDPGAVEITHWLVDGSHVGLCDADGVRTGDKQPVHSGQEPKHLAINLFRSKIGKRKSDFNREIKYPRGYY